MENDTEKRKMCRSAKSAAACLIAFTILLIITIISLELLDPSVSDFVGWSIAIFLLSLLVSSPLIAIFALLQIYRSNNILGGKKTAAVVIICSSLILFLMVLPAAGFYHRCYASRIMCGTNIGGIGKTLLTYAYDHNDQMPDDPNWCDLLIMYGYITPEQFICPRSDAKFGESSYALNKEVVGMKWDDIPTDMVILFETNSGKTGSKRDYFIRDREFAKSGRWPDKLNKKVYKDRWNQVGGPELLSLENHDFEGANFLYADMHVKFEKSPIPLRWKLVGDVNKADFNIPMHHKIKRRLPVIKIVLAAVLSLLVLISAFAILYKYRQNQYRRTTIIIGLISGCTGGLFGFLSEFLYDYNNFHHAGIIAGSIYAFFVAICFGAILAKTPEQIKQQKSFTGYAIASGMFAGIIFSTIIQIILMIISARTRYYGGPNFLGIPAGMPFGILAGVILGWTSARIFRKTS